MNSDSLNSIRRGMESHTSHILLIRAVWLGVFNFNLIILVKSIVTFKLVVTLVDRAQTLLLQEEKQLIKISLHSPFKRQEEVVMWTD